MVDGKIASEIVMVLGFAVPALVVARLIYGAANLTRRSGF
jgi:hypothetical protein